MRSSDSSSITFARVQLQLSDEQSTFHFVNNLRKTIVVMNTKKYVGITSDHLRAFKTGNKFLDGEGASSGLDGVKLINWDSGLPDDMRTTTVHEAK